MGRKIGIFGGSFNPIHVGHAIIANHVIQHTALDQLWLMVAPENPFKQGQRLAPDTDRLRMTEMVTRRLEHVTTSAFEFQLPKPSYTIDTLQALQKRFPEDEFFLVVGADNWVAWERWKSHDEIVKNYHVLIYPRLGYDVKIPDEISDRVMLIDAPVIEVSSTEIRDAVANHQSISFYVTDEVERYIHNNKIYITE